MEAEISYITCDPFDFPVVAFTVASTFLLIIGLFLLLARRSFLVGILMVAMGLSGLALSVNDSDGWNGCPSDLNEFPYSHQPIYMIDHENKLNLYFEEPGGEALFWLLSQWLFWGDWPESTSSTEPYSILFRQDYETLIVRTGETVSIALERNGIEVTKLDPETRSLSHAVAAGLVKDP